MMRTLCFLFAIVAMSGCDPVQGPILPECCVVDGGASVDARAK